MLLNQTLWTMCVKSEVFRTLKWKEEKDRIRYDNSTEKEKVVLKTIYDKFYYLSSD
jgi:hypothetical protein